MTYDVRAMLAQKYLASLGLYKGALDGIWGPVSAAAAAAWEDTTPASTADRHEPGITPYSLARGHVGVSEIPGKDNHPLIMRWLRRLANWLDEEETPWCSAFVNAMAAEAGYESSGKLNARSWLGVGVPIPAHQVKPGDVVVYWRVSKNSWEGHVGFVMFYDNRAGLIKTLGGNQADAVSIATYPASQVLGFRRLRTLESLQGNSGNRVL